MQIQMNNIWRSRWKICPTCKLGTYLWTRSAPLISRSTMFCEWEASLLKTQRNDWFCATKQLTFWSFPRSRKHSKNLHQRCKTMPVKNSKMKTSCWWNQGLRPKFSLRVKPKMRTNLSFTGCRTCFVTMTVWPRKKKLWTNLGCECRCWKLTRLTCRKPVWRCAQWLESLKAARTCLRRGKPCVMDDKRNWSGKFNS